MGDVGTVIHVYKKGEAFEVGYLTLHEETEESDNLPDPDVLAQEIVEDLEAAPEQFREIAAVLSGKQE